MPDAAPKPSLAPAPPSLEALEEPQRVLSEWAWMAEQANELTPGNNVSSGQLSTVSLTLPSTQKHTYTSPINAKVKWGECFRTTDGSVWRSGSRWAENVPDFYLLSTCQESFHTPSPLLDKYTNAHMQNLGEVRTLSSSSHRREPQQLCLSTRLWQVEKPLRSSCHTAAQSSPEHADHRNWLSCSGK